MLNHEPLRLADGEYRFACLVWDNEPLPSGQLVTLAAAALGWKKSTTYTVLKKLCERGVLQNSDGQVTSLIRREDVQQARTDPTLQHRGIVIGTRSAVKGFAHALFDRVRKHQRIRQAVGQSVQDR